MVDMILPQAREVTGRKHIRNKEMNLLLKAPRKELFQAMCYICKLKPRLGILDLQKCVDRGVKPGPLLGLLKNGEDVTLSDGSIILAKDVRTPDDPGPVFIVLDVPDISYLDSLVESECFKEHQEKTATNAENLPKVILHFTSNEIMKTEKYQNFLKTFPSSASHMIVNDSNKCNSSLSIHRMQYHLNILNKDIFPLINNYETHVDNLKENNENCKTLSAFHLRPFLPSMDRSAEIKLNVTDWVKEPFIHENFESTRKDLLETIESLTKVSSVKQFPKITFLGTGSCIPNKTRNTSGILVHISENCSIILDCGEGTYGQIVRFYGSENVDNILKNIKGIYISHLHADHHIGFINILQQRRKALNKLHKAGDNSIEDNLYLLAPKQIMSYLYLYDKRFERILQEFTLYSNSDLNVSCDKFNAPMLQNLLEYLQMVNIETCGVKHCTNAFGVSFTTKDMVKITYSGDTMPCNNLVDIGLNSDILIHEATMEDDLTAEAHRKFHSTTQQAINVAKTMKAKNTILTHFSQRYARVPRLSQEMEEVLKAQNVGIAFDNMEVSYDKLNILPHLYPALKYMFADHYEELENKANKRAMKRTRESSIDKNKDAMELKL